MKDSRVIALVIILHYHLNVLIQFGKTMAAQGEEPDILAIKQWNISQNGTNKINGKFWKTINIRDRFFVWSLYILRESHIS